jgi:hypothetical protein
MLKRVLTTCLTIGLMTVALPAQEPPPPAPPVAQNPGPPAAPDARRRNVSIEVTITDQTGTGDPVKKVVTMIVSDGRMGSVRSGGNVAVTTQAAVGAEVTERHAVTLNVDASPTIQSDGSILMVATVEYMPRPNDGERSGGRAQLNERMTVTLESGKPMVISRAADPGGNRRITIELGATVMK